MEHYTCDRAKYRNGFIEFFEIQEPESFLWKIPFRISAKRAGNKKTSTKHAFVFNAEDAGVFIKEQDLVAHTDKPQSQTINRAGKRIGAVSAELSHSFGKDFYLERSLADLTHLTKEEWQIRLEGQLCSTGKTLNITPYEELKAFIQQELGDLFWEEETR